MHTEGAIPNVAEDEPTGIPRRPDFGSALWRRMRITKPLRRVSMHFYPAISPLPVPPFS